MNKQIKLKDNVVITDNYHYANGFKGLTGLVVKVAGIGYNVFLPGINGAGNYFDQIFWFPAECIKAI